MSATIAYFLVVAYLGIPWTVYALIPLVFLDLAVGSQMPYIVHGPEEKWQPDQWEGDE